MEYNPTELQMKDPNITIRAKCMKLRQATCQEVKVKRGHYIHLSDQFTGMMLIYILLFKLNRNKTFLLQWPTVKKLDET